MRGQYEKIQLLGAEVLIVTFSAAQRIAQYLEAHGWPFPVVADPAFEAYRAFELQKGTWWQVAGPRAIVGYLKLMLRGRLPHSPTCQATAPRPAKPASRRKSRRSAQ